MRGSLFQNFSFLLFLTIFFGIFLLGLAEVKAQSAEVKSMEGPAAIFWQEDIEDFALLEKRMEGIASWYGGRFHGRKTASGERYNKHDFTCASKTLPFGTTLLITNLANGKMAHVRVNDRGPYRKSRILDVSYAVAKKLGFLGAGVAKVAFSIVSTPDLEDLDQGY